MILWLDAHFPPRLASWLSEILNIEAHPLLELGLLHAEDREIYEAAQEAEIVIMTKDSDFLYLLNQMGPPPRILWITCGNTSNTRLRQILRTGLPTAIELLELGESLVEIRDAQ